MATTAMAGRNDMASPARDPAACLGPSSSDAAHPAAPPDGVANVVQSPSSNATAAAPANLYEPLPSGAAQPAQETPPPPPAALTDAPPAEEDRGAPGQDTRCCKQVAQRLWLHARGAAQPATPEAATTQPDMPGDGAAQPAMHAGGPAQPAMSTGGAVRLFTQGHLQEVANSRHIVGCDVAKAALQTLLHHHHGDTLPGAADITDGAAFDWLPWMAHIESAPDVSKVCVVRWEPQGAPEAVFCYGKNMYSTLVPRTARCTDSCRTTRFRLYMESLLHNRPVAVCGPCGC